MTQDVDPLRIHTYSKLKEKFEANPASLSEEELQEMRDVEGLLGSELEETVKRVETERLMGFCAAGIGILLLGRPFIAVPLILLGAYLISGFKNPPEDPPASS